MPRPPIAVANAVAYSSCCFLFPLLPKKTPMAAANTILFMVVLDIPQGTSKKPQN